MSRGKKTISMTLVILIILSFIAVAFIVSLPEAKSDAFNGHYYGYGDSIMEGPPDDGPSNYTACWLSWMQTTYDPTNTSSHNTDGSSKTTTWGKTNFATHVTNWGWMTFEAFGVNDAYTPLWVPSAVTAQNKLTMWNWSVENNSEDHYWVCIPTLGSDIPTRTRAAQLDHQNVTMNLLKNYSIRFIPLWDAIDTIAMDGRRQLPNASCYWDIVHPNKVGHKKIAALSWYFVTGQDRTINYAPYDDITTITVNYNETIYVDKQSHWNWGNITVFCVNNGTNIGWSQGVDWHGNPTIHFNGIKGNVYEISDSSTPLTKTQFISICGRGNGTIIDTKMPNFNWTFISSAIKYQLQIATDSTFTSLVVNISDINESRYPSQYAEIIINETAAVSFSLPIENKLTVPSKYYCRVRAYVS